MVACDADTLLSTSVVNPKPDPQSVAAYFANHTSLRSSSYFKNLHYVVPGHWVEINPDKIKTGCYWQFQLVDIYRNYSSKDIADEFYDSLNIALKRSLGNYNNIAVLLSGGLDSSSMMALAMQLKDQSTEFLAVTHVFDKYSQCDERIYLESLYQRYDIRHLHINVDDCLPLANDPAKLHRNLNEIWVPPMIWQRRKSYPIIKSEGYNCFLTGEFGDHLFGAYRYWLRDLIKDHKSVATILPAFQHQIKVSEQPWYVDNVLRRVLPLNGITAGRFNRLPRHITSQARQLVHSLKAGDKKQYRGFEQDRYQSCLSQSSSSLSVSIRQEAQACGLASLQPYRDFALIEFTLNLPAYYFYDYRTGLHKHILRESMSAILPDKLRLRKNATVYNAIFRDSLTQVHKNVVADILLDQNRTWPEYIEEDYLLPRIGRTDTNDADLHLIWNCICYELWRDKSKKFVSGQT